MKFKLIFSNGLISDIICRGWGVTLFYHDTKESAKSQLESFKGLCKENGHTIVTEGDDFFTFLGPYSHGDLGNICTYAIQQSK